MKRISIEQILEIQTRLIAQTGGINGVRDMNLLDSAIMSPFQTFGGQDLYPNLHSKAAHLGYQLINNHPFLDGNKRIGIHTMFLFLLINGEKISAADNEKITLGLSIAQNSMKPEGIIE
ncbi:death-on-curing protein [Spirochaetia bacterium]|nr:death-on-curing protein [Spirochaetia bacterium]